MEDEAIKSYYNSEFPMPCYEISEFNQRIRKINLLFKGHVTNSVLDIGAGKGFWIDSFIERVNYYIAIERGEKNCLYLQKKYLNYSDKVKIINNDIFRTDFKDLNASTLIFSFFISHFQISTIINLLRHIRNSFKYYNILILDSCWSENRRNYLDKNQPVKQSRKLPNGSIIEIPKRYIKEKDIIRIASEMGMNYEIKYWDNYWLFIQIFNQGK